MKTIYAIILTMVLAGSCATRNKSETGSARLTLNDSVNDTIIGKYPLLDKVAGSAYLKRATGYFIIIKNDTSGFVPVFSESKEFGKVDINLNLMNLKNAGSSSGDSLRSDIHLIPYSQWLNEFKTILTHASLEYNLDSLKSITPGRLVLTGDLAIEITRHYKNRFGNKERITTADYKEIARFLLDTRLAGDFNELLDPYSLKVEKIVIEKAFFTSRNDLLENSVPETCYEEIPATILDCIVWMIIENK